MSNSSSPTLFLLYWFQVQTHQLDAFQTWAAERGMIFWQQQPGVLRYRTFRLPTAAPDCSPMAGQAAPLHGLSQVELESEAALSAILESPRFQEIQAEFVEFLVPGSLQYSILNCAYDSLAALSPI